MKFILRKGLLLLGVTVFVACGTQHGSGRSVVKEHIATLVERDCANTGTCQISLGEGLPFSWDKLYFFEPPVEADEIRRLTGSNYTETSAYYSRKLFFMKDDSVVHIEEHVIPDIDVPFQDGDIDFETSNSKHRYSVFLPTSIFLVEEKKLEKGSFFRLECKNCFEAHL